MKTHRLWLCAIPAALALGCGGPKDGVLSLAFSLAPPAIVTLPTEGDLGVKLDPLTYARASGTCTGTPPTASIQLELEGLPPLGVPKEKAYYRFTLLVGQKPLHPHASAFDRLLRALSPVGTAWADATVLDEVVVGEVVPDALGRAKLFAERLENPENIAGGRLDIAVPTSPTTAKVYKVLEGKVGNLSNEPAPSGPAPGGGGHQH